MAHSRLFRWFIKALAGLLMLIAAITTAALVYRAWRQHQAGQRMVISSADGIDEATFVPIGGSPQWVTIRGQNRKNPVVLMLHGGPGNEIKSFAPRFLPWEKDFVVVQWDQPGAGRTFGAAGRVIDPDLTVERIARDGNELAGWLGHHLHQPRIVLLGWSWGSALGVYMIKARPDLYSAYVGTGQVVSMQEGEALAYRRVLAKARQRQDPEAVEALEQIGPPPYDSIRKLGIQRTWASKYEGGSVLFAVISSAFLAPRGSLRDMYDSLSGMMQSQDHFFGPTMKGPFANTDLRRLGNRFELPVFVIEGTEDDYTPADLSRAWVDGLSAPAKAFIPIEGAGHLALITRGDEFLSAMLDSVRPVASR
jgi:pimeloyl-ACP methyl ester carboxylesterase